MFDLQKYNMNNNNSIEEGYLEIILGPMFSGKTTHIIQQYNTYKYIGKNIAVINYIEDIRYNDFAPSNFADKENILSTHDKIMIPCIMLKDLNDAWYNKSNIYYDKLHNSDVILINEGQFFDNLYKIVLEMVEEQNKIVHICGLDSDYKRDKFGEIVDLIPFCDKVTKLHSLCSNCKNGKKAIYSYRVSEETVQIVIGNNNYVPLCRKCYINNIQK